MIKIGVKNEDMRDSRIKGAIFCQVKKTISWGQWSESAIIGAHEWRGAMAPFRAKVNIMVTEYMELEERGVLEDVITISVAIIAEAEAWIIKYLIVESIVLFVFGMSMIGIKLRRLISKPIHTIIHDEEEIAIIVPIKIRIKKGVRKIIFAIKKRNIHIWGMGPLA